VSTGRGAIFWAVVVALLCSVALTTPAQAREWRAGVESGAGNESSETTQGSDRRIDPPDDASRSSDPEPGHPVGELELKATDKMFTMFPVTGPVSYTDSWGAPRSGGRTHKGTDIFAAKGTPIVAVAPGTVIGAGVSDGTAGIYVKIQHGDGDVSVYLHLDNDTPGTDDGKVVGIANGIDEGVTVNTETIIGYVGDSGNAETTPPHLHFEYRPDGSNSVNPFPLLKAVQGAGLTSQETSAETTLPFTGLETTRFAWLATALLAAGVSLLVAARRRQPIQTYGLTSEADVL